MTDKLRKASGSTRPVVTTLSLPKANGATSAELISATGWNTATDTDVVMYRRVLNTTTGLYEKVDGTQTDWTGRLTGTTLSGLVLAAGTEPAAGYDADGNTVVLAGPTAQWSDDLIETLLLLFNQDGSLKSAPIQTALGLGAGSLNGWNALGFAPNTVTANGNRSYDLVFNGTDLTGTLSPGMRLRTQRTVVAPTQSTSLNGTTQFYSKTSPAGMTFTDDFVAGAWVKLSSYASASIMSRFDGTNGWSLEVTATGQINLAGYNGSASNQSFVQSYQSIPLNKWVHITAQLDMSTFTATTTTSYIMIDGVDVPCSLSRSGTNPVAIATGTGQFQIGARNSLIFFPGKIAQAFVSSVKITQANVKTLYSQGLTSALITANSIISAYSFNNSINDLNTTNANNLTANGSAVATNADSPFGTQAGGSISSTLDYAIIQAATFSTNTTITVQVPEGCAIPTSGGVSAVVYSSAGKPYGMPLDRGKWMISLLIGASISSAGTVSGTIYNPGGINLNIPTGAWRVSTDMIINVNPNAAAPDIISSVSSSSTVINLPQFTTRNLIGFNSSNPQIFNHGRADMLTLSAMTPYYLLMSNNQAFTSLQLRGNIGNAYPESSSLVAENAYL